MKETEGLESSRTRGTFLVFGLINRIEIAVDVSPCFLLMRMFGVSDAIVYSVLPIEKSDA